MTTFHYPYPNPEQGPINQGSPFTELDPELYQALTKVSLGPSQADNLLQGENLTLNQEQLAQAKADLEAFANQLHPDTNPDNAQPRQNFIDSFRIEMLDNQPAIIPIDPNTKQPIEDYRLNIYNKGLTGKLLLPHQMQVRVLDCSLNQLTSLPNQLPDSLTRLDCSLNQLTSLPNQLPDSLTRLDCSHSRLTSLPNLPAGLRTLWCHNNQLTSLPDLPAGLRTLWCHENQLTSLPDQLTDLTTLWCANNQLDSLPDLPTSLTKLHCFHNQLTSLPDLPDSLTVLYCYNNQLTSLPDLPTSLTKLHCSYNQLTSLPDQLPDSLTALYCHNNLLTMSEVERLKKLKIKGLRT